MLGSWDVWPITHPIPNTNTDHITNPNGNTNSYPTPAVTLPLPLPLTLIESILGSTCAKLAAEIGLGEGARVGVRGLHGEMKSKPL